MELPDTLYHATYKMHLASILATGIHSPHWRTKEDVAWLSDDEEIALSYTEDNPYLPENSSDDDLLPVLLAVNTSKLDTAKLELVETIEYEPENCHTYVYLGVIPVTAISVFKTWSL